MFASLLLLSLLYITTPVHTYQCSELQLFNFAVHPEPLENTYTVSLDRTDVHNELPVDWAELHWTINDAHPVNVRLYNNVKQNNHQPGIVLKPGDALHLSATFQVDGRTACDTAVHEYINDSAEQYLIDQATDHTVQFDASDSKRMHINDQICNTIQYEKLFHRSTTPNQYKLILTPVDHELIIDEFQLYLQRNNEHEIHLTLQPNRMNQIIQDNISLANNGVYNIHECSVVTLH